MMPTILLRALEGVEIWGITIGGSVIYLIMWAVTRYLYLEEFYGELDETEGYLEGLLWPLALPAIIIYKLCKKWIKGI